MIIRILTIILGFIYGSGIIQAAGPIINDINIRDTTNISTNSNTNDKLDEFVANFGVADFFFTPSGSYGRDGLTESFTIIAFQIKNIITLLAVIFLAVAIVKLLFSPNDEESVKKWKSNIIWVSVGIVTMQIAFSMWKSLIIVDISQSIDSNLGWIIWLRVFSPIVGILQLLASFGFLLMVIYAFYTIVGSAGDEEKLKTGKSTIIYGLVGFFLMRFPEPIIKALYGSPDCQKEQSVTIGTCEIEKSNISGAVEIIGKIILYINGFLMLVCVLLVLYAGWLVMISAGDEEKLKKAKSTIIYVFIGFIVLIASHAIFRFFILS